MLQIQIKNTPLDLPQDFAFSVEDTSPIFNDRGSQSLPATVPLSGRNCLLLDAAHRLDAGADPNSPEKTATVIDGPITRRGTLNVTDAGRRGGITFNIGFDNSTAYAKWQSKKLTELDRLPVYKPDPAEQGHAVDLLLLDLYRIYQEPVPEVDPFAVFPVALNNESKDEDDETVTYWEVVNVPGDRGLEQPSKVIRLIDGEVTTVNVPSGYMVTPFVRVWRVLELIFEDLNLDIISNPFKEVPELALLVVLNNAADAICTGEIRYSDILPDCTVAAFLEALWVRFGLVYHIDDNAGTVKMVLLKDVLSQEFCRDLTPLTADYPNITYNSPEYIHLSAGTSIEGAAPAAERFEDFTRGLDLSAVRTGNDVSEWTNSGTADAPDWDGDVYDDYNDPWADYDPDDDRDDDRDPFDGYDDYYSRAKSAKASELPASSFLAREYITGKWFRLDANNGTVRESSSAFFDWDPQPENYTALELKSEDEFVPMGRVRSGSFNQICPLYLVGARHFHSYIKGSEETDKSGESTPLAFMFAYTSGRKTFGRLNPESETGTPIILDSGLKPSISLLFQFGDGLFARFWKEYDEILRHGNRTVEVEASIPKNELMLLDILDVYRLNGIRCLLDSVSYTLPAGPIVPVTLKLRTIQTQGTYKINQEQNVPEFTVGTKKLAWRELSSTYGPGLNSPELRNLAAAAFVERHDYRSRSHGQEVWFVAGDSAVFNNLQRSGLVWANDTTLPEPVHISQKITRKYKASVTYDMYELYSWQDNPEAPERDQYLGLQTVEVEYSVTLVPTWIPV